MSNDPRIDALAMWLEGEFDMHVYGSPTLGLMKAEDWQRLAVSALKFMDRAERDQASERWREIAKTYLAEPLKQPVPITAEERSRIEARENWTKKEAE